MTARSAPEPNLPFLTEIDPRAKVRGSRDALGLVPLWGHFGRHVVGNLTTVSTSPRGFTTLLLGYHFARLAQQADGAGPEAILPNFIKFEQLAGYSRWYATKDGVFRGVERVKHSLAEGDDIHLSADARRQILASQKIYGLWGLYSNPARSSGWLELQEAALTLVARDLVESRYIPSLTKAAGRGGAAIVDLLRGRSSRLHLPGRHDGLARAIARLMSNKFDRAEREVYWRHLVEGGPGDSTQGLQPLLAALMAEVGGLEPSFDRKQLRAILMVASQRGGRHLELAGRLSRIDRLESLLVPASSAFGFLLSRHGQKPAAIADEVGKAWGNAFASLDLDASRELGSEIEDAYGDRDTGERWSAIAQALRASDYRRFLALLIDQNAFVMRSRHASDPWVRIVDGRLDVRFRDEASRLVARSVLSTAWRSNFFLDPLKAMVSALRRSN